jgi:arylsulfatase A-like enzyme
MPFHQSRCIPLLIFLCLFLCPAGEAVQAREGGRPNVLFIPIDDMNDWTTLFDRGNPIRTPNLERVAKRGAFFTRAYTASPACNPSRAALLTGYRPHRSGIYGNRSDWRGALPGVKTLPAYFRENGYYVCGAGKTFHHENDWAFHDRSAFQEYLLTSINEPYPKAKLNGMYWFGTRNTDWGIWPFDIRQTPDHITAEYAIRKLQEKHDRPFFLSVGIYKPHSPFFAPSSYFDMYPLPELRMPVMPRDDMDDLPAGARSLQDLRAEGYGSGRGFWLGLQKADPGGTGVHASFVQAYQACASFADAMIGRVIDALDKSPYRDNTIIVIWSDHGFHVGEKQQIEKFALWEKTTHIPFIIVAPGVTRPGQTVANPVDMMSVFPTLTDLCGLEAPAGIDGISLVPLLRDPTRAMPPALMTYLKGNHAVRTERWRLIHYADGSEELYDHAADPHEWVNLAGRKEHGKVMDDLRKHIPRKDADMVADLR